MNSRSKYVTLQKWSTLVPSFHSFSSPKLSSLRKPNDVEPILQVFVSSQVFAHHVNLSVGILEEAIKGVLKDSISNLYGLHIDVGYLLLHQLDQTTQAERVTAAVTWLNDNSAY